MTRVLIVEDNEELAYGLAKNLEFEGYTVDVVSGGHDALERIATAAFDLVVLDLMLEGLDGFGFLRRLRGRGAEVPVLILSARDEELDKVRGFRLGADDYVTKPFGLLELLARIEALLRRSGPANAAAEIEFGAVRIDVASRVVERRGTPVKLSPIEFELLLALARRRGAAASRHDLLAEVWGHAGRVLTRTVDTHVAQLRRKLEEQPSAPVHLLTVPKYGYRLRLATDRPAGGSA